jgi:hypothetical protein
MKKFMLLASLMALAALMLAAAPAFAQTERVVVCHKEFGQGAAEFTLEIDRSALDAHLAHGDTLGPCEDDGDDGDDGDDNGDENGGNEGIIDRDRIRFNDVGNFEFAPTFEASQETEQECDTEEIDQSLNVTGGGDNSVTTVGLNPTANTGCAQTAVGILDADPIFAAQGGDLAFNFDDTNVVIRDDDCDGEDDDGDGNRDEDGDCDDNGDDNGNHNGDDNGDDNGDNVVDITDRDVFRFGGDQLNIHGGGGGEFDVNTDSTIDISPSLDVDGGGTINQTAIAVSVDDDHHKWWDHHKGWA